jgi:hypothetical protein
MYWRFKKLYPNVDQRLWSEDKTLRLKNAPSMLRTLHERRWTRGMGFPGKQVIMKRRRDNKGKKRTEQLQSNFNINKS